MGILNTLTYATQEVTAHWNDWEWWRNRFLHRVNGPVQQRVSGYDGVDVMNEDWDTLLVFDACRADLFEDHWDLSSLSSYRRETSKGSWTVEWATRNFTGQYGDTVYVTSNPLISEHFPERWHDLIEVWRTGFDERVQSVPPDAVKDAAVRAHEQYPDKRIIVHFVQPHVPFICNENLRFGGSWNDVSGWEGSSGDSAINAWEALRDGQATRQEVLRGYADNLLTLEQPTNELLEAIHGKVIVTSDHGNVMGTRGWPVPFKVYGHPPAQRLPGLVRVPWGEVTVGERREITTGSVESTSRGDESEVESRLQALGYK